MADSICNIYWVSLVKGRVEIDAKRYGQAISTK